jgi:hypothetical protein
MTDDPGATIRGKHEPLWEIEHWFNAKRNARAVIVVDSPNRKLAWTG